LSSRCAAGAEGEADSQIVYMKCYERKTPRDYNYARLRKKQSIKDLTHRLIKKDQEINQLRGYTSLIRGVRKCSENIHKLFKKTYVNHKMMSNIGST
jgi:hypothetical protein